MTFRIGLLSTARINRLVLAGARASRLVEVTAVASRDGDRARAYAAKHGIPHAHESYDALLADPEVDAVYVSLPNAMHVEWTRRALEAGKHVLCEKPLSRRPEEVEALFDRAERSGLTLTEGFMWRHHPQADALMRLVGSGAVGRLRLVRAAFSFQLAAVHGAADARFDPALDGGSLMDVGCYCVSALRLVAGEPTSVRAERVVGPSGVDVVVAAVLRFADGVVGHLDCGLVLPYRDELEVVGDVASVFLDDPWHARAPVLEVRREPEPERIVSERVDVATADAYRLELENLADAVAGRAPLLLGRDDAVGQARVLDALHRSAESGFPVDL